jgi:leucyl aminopeptidase
MPSLSLAARADRRTRTLVPLAAADLPAWLKRQDTARRRWVEGNGFTAAPDTHLALPAADGGAGEVLLGVRRPAAVWDLAGLPLKLPEGRYRLAGNPARADAEAWALGWALGAYQFARYRKPGRAPAELVWPQRADKAAVSAAAEATNLVRDLINTPASDMGPGELAAAARKLARTYKAQCRVTTGEALLKQNYPMIHAVGRAAAQAPRLIDIAWGNARHPKLTLVGKGVCFDTGGLDLKPATGMLDMKKDMGGAAHVLGLASMVMARKLKVRLRVLIPAVENSVSGNAFRPRDILTARDGTTVEVGNTDAEGRLVLADALVEAARETPAMILDYATLTGAARVALGAELPALFCNDETLAADFLTAGAAAQDPLWRLPLHADYRRHLKSRIADTNNVSPGSYGGAITAALFLERFVADIPWAHIDLMAWNQSPRPGRPQGGEALALRAAFAMLERRFG